MTDNERLRAFAQGLIDEADRIVDECGVVGGHTEVTRAEVARQLIAILDSLPPLTSSDRIPPAIREALDRYGATGLRTGSCLQAVLEGDMFGAFGRAGAETLLALPAIVAYIRTQLQPGSYGSPEIVARWIARPRS